MWLFSFPPPPPPPTHTHMHPCAHKLFLNHTNHHAKRGFEDSAIDSLINTIFVGLSAELASYSLGF
jgi:hypothetical protein